MSLMHTDLTGHVVVHTASGQPVVMDQISPTRAAQALQSLGASPVAAQLIVQQVPRIIAHAIALLGWQQAHRALTTLDALIAGRLRGLIESETFMEYLLWGDDSKKKPTEQKIRDGMARYEEKGLGTPNLVLVNPSQAGVEIEWMEVRADTCVRVDQFWIGRSEQS